MTENFQDGCILLSRSLMDSAVFQNEKWLKVWMWCLLKANHKKQQVPIITGKGQTVVEIDRGQFIFGRHKAAESLKMNPSTVRNVMDKLEKLQNIAMQKDSHYTIVTICNYEQYQNIENYKGQAKGQPKDNQRTTKGQPKDTNNNENNVNNDKNKKTITSESVDSSAWDNEDLWLYNLIKEEAIFTSPQKAKLHDYSWWHDVHEVLSGFDPDFIKKQFAEMRIWKKDNGNRWPTDRGIRKFVKSWLVRAKEFERRRK